MICFFVDLPYSAYMASICLHEKPSLVGLEVLACDSVLLWNSVKNSNQARKDCSAEETRRLFFEHVVKLTHQSPIQQHAFNKIFKHFNVYLHGEEFVSLRPTDIKKIHTLKHMKIVKVDGQWMARTKGFDAELGPLTLPFDGDDEEDDDEDDVTPCHIPSSSAPRPTEGFTFTKDHYNLLNRRIDSLTSPIDGFGGMLRSIANLTKCNTSSTSSDASIAKSFYVHFYAHFSPPLHPEL